MLGSDNLEPKALGEGLSLRGCYPVCVWKRRFISTALPFGPILYVYASVAQGIEHRSPKAGVGRSNRPGGTRIPSRWTA